MGRKLIKRVERVINGIPMEIELVIDLDEPERNRFEFEGRRYCWIIRKTKQIEESSPLILYDAFTEEITHPKAYRPIYRDHEILVFKEELTQDEIKDLERKLGKKIRRRLLPF